jgi:hypothetical protein
MQDSHRNVQNQTAEIGNELRVTERYNIRAGFMNSRGRVGAGNEAFWVALRFIGNELPLLRPIPLRAFINVGPCGPILETRKVDSDSPSATGVRDGHDGGTSDAMAGILWDPK